MKWWMALIVFLSHMSAVSAEMVAKCGTSKGFSYYFEGRLVPREKAGWRDDGIAKGSLLLLLDGEQFDVVITDAVGSRSIRTDGFEIISIPQSSSNTIVLLAVNSSSGIVEHYHFRIEPKGDGTVVWGSIKGSGALLQKSSMFQAACISR
jgi:hypothetical protein